MIPLSLTALHYAIDSVKQPNRIGALGWTERLVARMGQRDLCEGARRRAQRPEVLPAFM